MKTMLAFAVAVVLPACAGTASSVERIPAAPAEEPAASEVSAEVVANASDEEGWSPLFDGTSLEGWENIDYGGEGPVELVDGALRLGMGSMLTGIRRTSAAELPRFDYELEVVAARLAGTDFFCGLTFPVGESHATLVLGGWGGGLTGLSCIDGLDASDNETKTYRAYPKGRDFLVRVRVTRARIQAWIDGESVVDVALAGRTLGLRPEVFKSQPLGISSYATVARVRSVRLRRLAPER